jgi:glycosyltransferase involved in cell wall biosynthesis
VFDRAIGSITSRRPLSGRPYIDAANALGPDYDGIVFVHNEPSGVEPIASRCPKARVCLWVHNQLFTTYTRRQARRVVEQAHRVICVSEFIARGVRAKAGNDPRIVSVLNGVDTEKFVPADPPPRNDPPVILFIGRMVPEKGPDLLLKAAIELKRQGVRFKLRMVGSQNFNSADSPSPFQQQLVNCAASLDGMVEFLPFQPRSRVVEIYQGADLMCVPSNWDDPCPLTILEGMACGLPVAASHRGGVAELAGSAAAYFEPPNHFELATRLRSLIAEREILKTVGAAGRERAHQFSWTTAHYRLASLLSRKT